MCGLANWQHGKKILKSVTTVPSSSITIFEKYLQSKQKDQAVTQSLLRQRRTEKLSAYGTNRWTTALNPSQLLKLHNKARASLSPHHQQMILAAPTI